ncbi:MAG: hypothetical protein DSZ33_06790 [Gammaproteobacteria bacterium]|nr:MAG: hypothetical protein DSZ33_06790 [Gammaproteobacteria bacterium]
MTNLPPKKSRSTAVLTTFIGLEQEARKAQNHQELAFLIVNKTHQLLPYTQAFFWRYSDTGKVVVEAVSGVAKYERNAPHLQWVRSLVKAQAADREAAGVLRVIEDVALPVDADKAQEKLAAEQVLWAPMPGPDGKLRGGLLIFRPEPFKQHEMVLLERLMGAYGHAWAALERNTAKSSGLLKLSRSGKVKALIAAGIIGAMFIPVHISVLAPAEVVATDPVIVSAPSAGVVKSIHVKPNQAVKKGDLLFSLDDADVRSKYEVARKEAALAQADYHRATQKAFGDMDSRAQLKLLDARVKQKQLEVNYLGDLLNRIEVRADQDGVAVFNDVNDWIGKPVDVGQKVMVLADPQHAELEALMRVGDTISVKNGNPVKLFLNTDPTRPLPASVYRVSYDATEGPDGSLGFIVKSTFDKDVALPRIGLKGTAKIYGDKVTLFYYLMRRPLASLRQNLGL